MAVKYKKNELIEKLADLNFDLISKWAIYGTGNGASLIYSILEEMGYASSVKYFIDRDDMVDGNRTFCNISVIKLQDAAEQVAGIIIAAFDHHEIIKNRIETSLSKEQLAKLTIIDIFVYNVKRDCAKYAEYIERSVLKQGEDFVPFSEGGYCRKEGDVKTIAWYLPQFHQLEINNKFHGQGFTEWTNTSTAIPMFTGHYQPHIPYDVGYYDLLNPETWKRQIYLAKHYGIYGFCIHYYWFSGTHLMEKPLELLLEHKELDMPFCLNWATENWTALWDGGNKEIMLEQKLEAGDDERFMADILPYMKDSRYIKIDGKPILVIYRINMFEKGRANRLLKNFREIAKREGFPDLYIMLTNAFDFMEDVKEWGADAIVEFPPFLMIPLMEKKELKGYVNPYFNGEVYDATEFVDQKSYFFSHDNETYFRSALVSWDNTARKARSFARIMTGLTPATTATWLKDIIAESKKIHSESEHIVFVNSWNEWAEGSHLEPDMKYGYAYLQAIKDVLEDMREDE